MTVMGGVSLAAAERPINSSGGLDWAVQLAPGVDPDTVAASLGAVNRGPIGILEDTYRFTIRMEQAARPGAVREAVRQTLSTRPEVVWEEEQEPRVRVVKAPRDEPLFAEQWYLENTAQAGGIAGIDTGAARVWEMGYTGAGVGVVINDTGTAYTHPDLNGQYVRGLDLWDDDADASPESADEDHGTAVSGIVLASANKTGSVGIAPGAQLYPVRLLRDGEGIPDADEAEALSFEANTVGVSNNSWGPSDSGGIFLASMGRLVRDTLAEATRTGRGGKGTVFVWAAGNGGNVGDRSSYDGYNNSPYTISVGAFGQNGRTTGYSEPGSNVFISAPSASVGTGITTTDRPGALGYASGDYTDSFSGTSAAAPMVSGVVALMLEANPELTWRDVQHILARTAVRTDRHDESWQVNGAGFGTSELYGFGRVDAVGAVRLAEQWAGVGEADTVNVASSQTNQPIPDGGILRSSLELPAGLNLEHVEVTLNLTHSAWRQLEIVLISPNGTRSLLSAPFEEQSGGFGNWTFMSVQTWGEASGGTWRIEIRDTEPGTIGILRSWSIRAHGTEGAANPFPKLARSTIRSGASKISLDPALLIEGGDAGEWQILSAFALERGTVEEASGEGEPWIFRVPLGGYGAFPVGLTVASATTGEARHLVLTVERPALFAGTGNLVELPFDATPTIEQGPTTGELSVMDWSLRYQAESFGEMGFYRSFLRFPETEEAVWVPILVDQELAFSFDGRDDVIGLENLDLTDAFTVDTWIRPDWWGEANGGGVGFGRILDSNNVSIFLNGVGHAFYPDAAFVVYLSYANGESEAFVTEPNTVQLGDWQRFSVSVDMSQTQPVRLFLDGQEQVLTIPPEVTPQTRSVLLSNDGETVYIGESGAGTRAYEGLMARYRLWDGALTASELAQRGAELSAVQRASARVALTLKDTSANGIQVEGTAGARTSRTEFDVALIEAPWTAFEDFFVDANDTGSGWWEVPALGWVFGDRFPWSYAPGLDWFYASGEGGESFWFYRPLSNLGWMYFRRDNYPWVYVPSLEGWAYHYNGTPWFYVDALGRYEVFDK